MGFFNPLDCGLLKNTQFTFIEFSETCLMSVYYRVPRQVSECYTCTIGNLLRIAELFIRKIPAAQLSCPYLFVRLRCNIL